MALDLIPESPLRLILVRRLRRLRLLLRFGTAGGNIWLLPLPLPLMLRDFDFDFGGDLDFGNDCDCDCDCDGDCNCDGECLVFFVGCCERAEMARFLERANRFPTLFLCSADSSWSSLLSLSEACSRPTGSGKPILAMSRLLGYACVDRWQGVPRDCRTEE
jgi:hypothetical protein